MAPPMKKARVSASTRASSKEKSVDSANQVFLGGDSNQALGLARFALDFLSGSLGPGPDPSVLARVELFHVDSLVCGVSALALKTNAPTLLREEAQEYRDDRSEAGGVPVLGSDGRFAAEKAICSVASAVREWDSNGTVFGYNEKVEGHTAGEFGHNDFYAVCVAACQQRGLDGKYALLAMCLLDEIRGRLAEVFSLKSYKIDHVVHGAIASAATYGALMGATAEQIESAIGMVVAHYIPWRAIRAGHQLSDSKGASAALSTEVAILSMKRSMRGFMGPRDIFRNPEAIFRQFEPTEGGKDESPFDLVLSHSGSDFAVMGMHFKLGLYEHQSAGALQGVINVLQKQPELVADPSAIKTIKVVAYEPAFGIIGDPAKRNPTTRQSADHSMVYIISRLISRSREVGVKGVSAAEGVSNDQAWKSLLLTPFDYSKDALFSEETRALMDKVVFEHGGEEYDQKYPDGIPTSVQITNASGEVFDSGFVMYPAGHARNTDNDLVGILNNKFKVLGSIGVGEANVEAFLSKISGLEKKSAEELMDLYNFEIQDLKCID